MNRRHAILTALAVLAACSPKDDGRGGAADSAARPRASSGGGVDLTGAGATFPYALYSKWSGDYMQKTGIKINYQQIGSGGGIRQLSEQTVDFGGTDSPMSDEELGKAKGGPILHIPTVLGAVVITYNVPGLAQPLKLDGPTIADIYLGKITKWNDVRLRTLNPGAALPASDIVVVHRSDGSGTTFIFTDYLSAVSPEWKSKVGKSKEVQWPTGLGAKGNDGVAGQVKQTPGTIGYVELIYARQTRLSYASVKNASGAFVEPSVETTTAAAAGALSTMGAGSDFRVSIVNAAGANAYPISSFTWLIVYQNQPDSVKGKKLVDFMRWALHDGQQAAAALDFAPLPASLVEQLDQRLATIRVGGATPAATKAPGA